MKVLIVGSGGREHSIAWKISQSPKVSKIYCIPGNAGISQIAECISVDVSNIEGIKSFCQLMNIDLVIIGPELPLSLGIVDELNKIGIKTFGPDGFASRLESNKIFAKKVMKKFNIPTAEFMMFDDPNSAKQLVNFYNQPLVIKASGLASGKGVFVCNTKDEACEAIDKIMVKKIFGDAGNFIIVEKKLEGHELSFMTFVDGKHIATMPCVRDYKQLSCIDNINTGGMAAIGPIIIDRSLYDEITDSIIAPLIIGLSELGIEYKGVLYIGLMIDKNNKPKVLEFNVRFGDPECAVLMSLLKTDLIDIIQAVDEQKLDEIQIEWKDEYSACIVMASKGYPNKYEIGKEITGLNSDINKSYPNTNIFHAGTKIEGDKILTNGGRVLEITSTGKDLNDAINDSYNAIKYIYFDGMYYRGDIVYASNI